MIVVFVALCIVTQALQSVFKKKINEKCEHGEFMVGAMISLFALLYFVIFSDNVVFGTQIIPYSIAFSICYVIGTVTCVFALACGSLAFTNLMLAYSCILPLGYSLIYCGEALKAIQVIGIIALALSFLFTYYPDKKDAGNQKFSLKWLVYVFLLFLSNGMCMVIQQMQQRVFGGKYDASFMIISLVMAMIILIVCAFIRERKNIVKTLKNGVLLSGLCGACNGAANYFGLLCLLILPGSVYHPLISAGNLVLTYVLSVTLFKEKFQKNQVIGFILGIVSMVLININ